MKIQEQKHTSIIKKILFLFPLALLTLSALANIIMAATVSDVGARTHDFETKTAIIQAHSDELRATLATKQSLSQLKTYALEAGFVNRAVVTALVHPSPKLAFASGI